MSPGLGRVGKGMGALVRAMLCALALSLAATPAMASYVEESPSPTPSPTPTRGTPSPTPSPTYSEPLPPTDEDYWEDINDPEYEPPSPEPTATSAQPRERHDRVGPTGPQQGGRIDVEADSRPDGQQQDGTEPGAGREPGLYSRDAYPPGTFDGGYGLFTPEIQDMPITADPDAPPPLPARGSRSTEPIIRRLREAKAPLDQVARTLAPFPVAGLAEYAADWTPPATAKGIEAGKGAAIHAKEGTPVVASANGPIHRVSPDPAWGTTLELTGPDGTRYRYGRLLRVAPAIQDGMKVTRGQIVGFVGGTGTIPGGSYLWFQLVGKDGAVVTPFEYLDRWLKEALVTARVTTGLPAVDKADEVAAGLLSPEEAGIKIGPDGRPISDEQELSALEAFLSSCFFAFLGWRGVRAWRKRRRKQPPAPERLDIPAEPLEPDVTAEISTSPAAT